MLEGALAHGRSDLASLQAVMDEKGPCEVGLKPLAAVLREIRRDAVVLFARPQELLPHSAPSPHCIRRYARSQIRLQVVVIRRSPQTGQRDERFTRRHKLPIEFRSTD